MFRYDRNSALGKRDREEDGQIQQLQHLQQSYIQLAMRDTHEDEGIVGGWVYADNPYVPVEQGDIEQRL